MYSNRCLMLTIACVSLTFCGCGGDSDSVPTAPQVGTVSIDREPNSLDASWQILGPDGYSLSGTGDATLANMARGNYTLTWMEVVGWTIPTPSTVTQTLAADGILTFTGTYTVQPGTIVIDSEPDSIDAPWEIEGPNSFSYSGTGDAALENMVEGAYTLTWGQVAGWRSPNPIAEVQLLAVGGSLTFLGEFVPAEGSIAINPEPNEIDAPWHISGPNGFSQTGTGDETLENMTSGTYTLTWGDVADWSTPDPGSETEALETNGSLEFSGTYEWRAGVIVVDPAPDSIAASWQLEGPVGFNHSGSGDATIENLPAGNYSISWGDVAGWISPSPSIVAQTLEVGGSLTFSGTYASQSGTISIDPEPNEIDAPWSISGPNGFSQVGSGDTALESMDAGTYTLVWGEVTGWWSPSPVTVIQTLVVDQTLQFSGTYIPQSGSVVINPEPDSINAPWEISGPNGFSQTGNGDTTLEDMEVGSYSVSWGDVPGWVTPFSSPQSVFPGATIEITGTYYEGTPELIASIDIDRPSTQNTAPGFVSLLAVNDESIVVSGIGVTIFGISGADDRLIADPLLTDFAYVAGGGGESYIGIRLEGLPAGVWDINSWHYDSNGWQGILEIQLRTVGGSTEVLLDGIEFSTSPANYRFISDGSSVYELLYVPTLGVEWQSRLNGLQISRF